MAVKKPGQQKGGRAAMRRLFASIHEDVHKALRLYAAEKDVEMQEVIEEALKLYFEVKKGETKN